jgi:hypothetical protein
VSEVVDFGMFVACIHTLIFFLFVALFVSPLLLPFLRLLSSLSRFVSRPTLNAAGFRKLVDFDMVIC